ncbi:MAG: cache domain-containing protein [Planctomycetota bacterium]
MKILLQAKLIIIFFTVIIITGIVATIIGVMLIGNGIVREAQNKVNLDLNSARQVYQQKLRDIHLILSFTAIRRVVIREALQKGNIPLLLQSLKEVMQQGELDFLTITNEEGTVVLRAQNPEVLGDSQADDEIVKRVISEKKSCYGTQIVNGEQLLKESEELAERARIELITTPMAKPTTDKENTSGMLLKAAAPIIDDSGALIGTLYGGILINRNYEIVDKTKNIVFKDEKYKGKDIGTATIFQKDLRISTNVKSHDNKRAIGTRISSEVYDKVIGERKTWNARAFVVTDWYLTAYEPIKNVNDDIIGILYVGILEKKYTDLKNTTFWLFVGVTAAGMLLALIAAYFLSATISKPIQQLKQGVEEIAKGNFDFEVTVKTSDEVGSLAGSFNRVRLELKETYKKLQGEIEAADEDIKKAYKELKEKQQQLIRAEKLASIGKLSAGVAHEINNPLTAVLTFSHLLLEDTDKDDPKKEDLELIIRETERCKNIVKGLLDYARQTEPQKLHLNINTIIEKTLSLIEHQAAFRNIKFVREFDNNLPFLMIDKDKFQQIFINLFTNAQEAMPKGGSVTITTSKIADGKNIEIKIADTGSGISEEVISKIFDPFYSTKEMGTGLGLSITQGIIESHKGGIEVKSKANEGTTFTIRLPVEEFTDNR